MHLKQNNEELTDEQKIDNLKELHARDGGVPAEEASFICPRCGTKPIYFVGNRKWNDGLPVLECLCLAPFSFDEEKLKKIMPEGIDPRRVIVSFPWTADSWGVFVEEKLSLGHPIEELEEDEQ